MVGQDVSESSLQDVSRFVYESIKPQIYPVIQEEIPDDRHVIKVEFHGEDYPYSAVERYYLRAADEDREVTLAELRQFFIANEYKEKSMNGKLRNMTSLYLRRENELLLLYRMGSRVIADSYIASVGGHFEKEELNDARACVLRELQEETGLTERNIANLSLRYITLRRKNDEIRQNYYFFADLVNCSQTIASNEGKLKWFRLEELLENMPKMPFTAHYVVKHYAETGKDTHALYVGIAAESGVDFAELTDFK